MGKKPAAVAGLVVVALLSLTPAATPGEMALDGGAFLAACSKPEPDWIGFCHGYVQAVFDEERPAGESVCPPEGTTRAEIVGNVVRVLVEIPALHSYNAAAVVHGVLRREYPCP